MEKIEQALVLYIFTQYYRNYRREAKEGDIIESSQSTKLQCKTESPLSVSGELKGWALQDEGQDGGAEGRVIAELLQVAAVLPFGPHSHLDETHQCEEGHRQALGHQCEAQPGAQLVGVVGAGDQHEDPGEGVLGGIGNLPGLRAWWTEVPQSDVDGKVANLTEQE